MSYPLAIISIHSPLYPSLRHIPIPSPSYPYPFSQCIHPFTIIPIPSPLYPSLRHHTHTPLANVSIHSPVYPSLHHYIHPFAVPYTYPFRHDVRSQNLRAWLSNIDWRIRRVCWQSTAPNRWRSHFFVPVSCRTHTD